MTARPLAIEVALIHVLTARLGTRFTDVSGRVLRDDAIALRRRRLPWGLRWRGHISAARFYLVAEHLVREGRLCAEWRPGAFSRNGHRVRWYRLP